jgi:hypothetical protein
MSHDTDGNAYANFEFENGQASSDFWDNIRFLDVGNEQEDASDDTLDESVSEPCNHCWHHDGTSPTQHQLICCHCGKRPAGSVNPRNVQRDDEHGEHMNKIPAQYRK